MDHYDKYKLVDPVLGRDSTHFYSCHSTDPNDECEEVHYQISENWDLLFNEGDTFDSFYHHTSDSSLKNRVDYIYSTYLTNYTSYLEDIPWCNDRSGNESLFSTYNSYNRVQNGTPSLACRQIDSFTVSNSAGNQSLTNPVATLTVDELMYAGLTENDNNLYNYLRIQGPYWTMTPRNYDKDNSGRVYIVDANGKISSAAVNNTYNYSRAVVSLKPNTMIVSGNGTKINPYKVAQ